MAASTSSEEWERWRNAIHTLYILENLPLSGPSGVIETMKLRYGFCATKRQYEYRFQEWGLEKNMPGGNYPIIASKLGKRKAAGMESNVFWKGGLVPAAKVRKESSRHGYMTTLERLSRAQAPAAASSPETPPGVDICTPPPYPVFRKVFQELPTLNFLRSDKIALETLQHEPDPVSALGSVLRMPANAQSPESNRIAATVRSLIPISAFEDELFPASSTVLGDLRANASQQLLMVAAYLVSNNFPDDCNRAEIHKWLKRLHTSYPAIFQSLQVPSNQALLQGLLRLAVEEGDAPMAGALLDAGADPNGNTCDAWPGYRYYPIALTPLQYSCLHGNLELVKELLRAKAQIDRLEFGWSCSPLLFAICGFQQSYYDASHPFAEQPTTIGTSHDGVADSGSHDDDDRGATLKGDGRKGRRLEVMITLISELLNAGADVNAIPGDFRGNAQHPLRNKAKLSIALSHHSIHSLMCEKHSPLTLGAAFRCPELVDSLIRNGAHAGFRVDGARSALRECLYTSEERSMYGKQPLTLEKRVCGPILLSRVVETAKRLIVAQVDVNDHAPCGISHPCEHGDFECYSALDLAVLSQDKGLAAALWSAGAKPTYHALDMAMKVLQDFALFCQLLNADLPLPPWAFTDDELPPARSKEGTELQKRRAMILAAIWLGACTDLERLTALYDCSSIFGHLGNNNSDNNSTTALKEAVKMCCDRGYKGTLVCLLQSDILPPGFLVSVSGFLLDFTIQRNHLEIVDVLLKAGADANATIGAQSPLQLAIQSKNGELVRKLIDNGAYAESPRVGNLLVSAIQAGDPHVIRLLMKIASPNSWGYFSLGRSLVSRRWSSRELAHPLAAAIYKAQWALADELLRRGALVNPRRQGALWTYCLMPLGASVLRRNITLTRWLIDNGAELNDEFALEVAAAEDDPAVLQLLVEGLSSDKRSGKPNALHVALHSAIHYSRLRNARLILDSKIVDVHAFSRGESLLRHALHSPLPHRREFLRLLLEAGANPDTLTDDPTESHYRVLTRFTGLLEAIRKGDAECVRIILEWRAKTNGGVPPEAAYSPLQLAALKGASVIVRMLLDHGHNPDIVSPCGTTDGWKAGKIGTSVQNATTEKKCEILRMLLQHGANPNLTTRQCRHTALQIACRDGSLELVKLLLEYGANVNAPPAEEHGATALQFAAIRGHLGMAHLLLEKGADVNAAAAPFGGRTAFEGAAEHGRDDIVQLLKNAGADISEAGQGQFERAWERATRNGHLATRALLKSFLS